jgi:hypothetical protein
MSSTDDSALAALAADFRAWHVWRSRDARGRDAGWNATRRVRPATAQALAGILARISAGNAGELRGLLDQQEALTAEAGCAA